ncbi:MAG: archaellin/type IV pilin N-terminal domain-containing protein [Nitrososphaerota archaeon]|nr:archaellin/type IV pilin N-terminal domain-containing protein [Nitrososphaerota archaeon]
MRSLRRSRRGIIGIEAAIVMIAFVIVAAAFSFMVVNMGLYATQRGREVINQGITESGCPLTIDGTILVWSNKTGQADAFIIPLKTMGTKWVAMAKNETVVSLMINSKAWANVYQGIGVFNGSEPRKQIDPTNLRYETIIANLTKGIENIREPTWWGQLYNNETGTYITGAVLVVENSNGDDSLHYYEKGFLIIILDEENKAPGRSTVVIEIRPEKGAPLTIEFVIPEALTKNSYVTAG